MKSEEASSLNENNDLSAASGKRSLTIQRKLTVGAVDDPLQHEADAMADQVMRMPEPGFIQRKCSHCEDEEAQRKPVTSFIQKKETGNSNTASDATHSQIQSTKGGGSAMPANTKTFMESRFGADFSGVRIHSGGYASQLSKELNAQAFTVGNDIYFNNGKFFPESSEGKHLLAHELAHTVQQTQKNAEIQKKPADLKAGRVAVPYDEDKIKINAIDDFSIGPVAGSTNKAASRHQIGSATTTEANIARFKWEVYDPSDQLVADADLKSGKHYPALFSNNFLNAAVEGRYYIRCTGLNSAKVPVAYAEDSFYIWTSKPLEQQGRKSLGNVKSHPSKHTLGEVGAANARDMMLEHRDAVDKTGTGTIAGNKCSFPPAAGTMQHDCTTYVLTVLEKAFTDKGLKAAWDKIFKDAKTNSAGPLKGTEVLKSLVNIGGWKAVFWSPDPRNPSDSLAEHSTAYKTVKEKGTYYGIGVEKNQSVVEYNRTSGNSREEMSQLDKLKKIPLGVIAAKGGMHMTLLLNGVVYEVHWDKPETDRDVIEATPLEKWGWNSGVIVMPAADYANAFP